jgi:hypothetical protein
MCRQRLFAGAVGGVHAASFMGSAAWVLVSARRSSVLPVLTDRGVRKRRGMGAAPRLVVPEKWTLLPDESVAQELETLSVQIDGLSAQISEAFKRLTRLEADLSNRAAELSQRAAALQAREAELAEQEARSAQGHNEIANREERLGAREESAVDEEPSSLEAGRLGEAGRTDAPATDVPSPSDDSSEVDVVECALFEGGPVRPARTGGSEISPAAHQVVGADGAAGDSVDTVDFTDEEFEKLRVLRRLGAQVSDEELIARIRSERVAQAKFAGRDGKHSKAKRRWFRS